MMINETEEAKKSGAPAGSKQGEGGVFSYLNFDFALYQYRQMWLYLVIFFVLFFINLIHRRVTDGTTLSLVVKMYLFVFAFFLIYNVTIAAPDEIKKRYLGRTARIFYIFESKLLPVLTLYCMIALYTVSDFANEAGWPWFAAIRALDGQHTNMIVYSLILMYALKSKITPVITIPVFFALSFVFYRINQNFYHQYFAGYPVLIYKGIKLSAIFFLSIWDLSLQVKSGIKRMAFAVAAAGLTLGGAFAFFMLMYSLALPGSPLWTESGKKLARFGYSAPLAAIAQQAAQKKDVQMFRRIYLYMEYYDLHPDFDRDQWEGLLYQSRIEDADLAASYMLKEGVICDAFELANYAESKLKTPQNAPLNNLISLCAKSCTSDESILYLLHQLRKGESRTYDLWLIRVLSETGSCLPVIPLAEKIFSLDNEIAKSSYEALKSLTGKSPAESAGVPYNSVESLREFKEFYRESCTEK